MISRKNETVVGLFVVASLVLLFIMVIIIARHEGLWAKYVHYQTMFKDVKGLQKGNEVRLSGVTIGSVTQTIVQPNGEILVKFKVKAKQQKNIHEDAVATIGSIGLLGDRSLDISFGTPPSRPSRWGDDDLPGTGGLPGDYGQGRERLGRRQEGLRQRGRHHRHH